MSSTRNNKKTSSKGKPSSSSQSAASANPTFFKAKSELDKEIKKETRQYNNLLKTLLASNSFSPEQQKILKELKESEKNQKINKTSKATRKNG